METVTLKTEKRDDSGKKSSAALRRNGKIPCVMYGGGTNRKLTVDANLLYKTLSTKSGRRIILKLEFDGEKGAHSTILKELQYHPITDKLIHADLLEIDLAKPLEVKLPVELVGEPVGVKIKGGELRFHARTITVECLPEAMPAEIKVDVSNLDINESYRIKDIKVPEGITKKDHEELSVVSVGEPKVEEVKATDAVDGAEADATPADGAEPKKDEKAGADSEKK